MPLTATCFNYVLLPTLGAVVTSAGVNTNIGPGAIHGQVLGGVREQRLMLTLDNASSASLAYPTSGGIPLSTILSDWGMKRNLDYVQMYGHGFLRDPSGPVTEVPLWVLNDPPSGGRFLRGFGAWITGASPSDTARDGFPELTTTFLPANAAGTYAFYFIAKGW